MHTNSLKQIYYGLLGPLKQHLISMILLSKFKGKSSVRCQITSLLTYADKCSSSLSRLFVQDNNQRLIYLLTITLLLV